MSDDAPKKRHWPTFAWLSAFAVFFAACLWGRSQLVLVNDRREFLSEFHNSDSQGLVIALSKHRLPPHEGLDPAPAPWPVRALGGDGVSLIWIDGRASAEAKTAEIARLKKLFPEAEIADAPPPVLKQYVAVNAARLKRLKNSDSPLPPTADPLP